MNPTCRPSFFKAIITLFAVFLLEACDVDGGRNKWATYIPGTREVAADVMVLKAPPDIEDIIERMQEAYRRNPVWFRNHLAQLARRKTITYHKNFGVTKEELQRYLFRAEHMRLEKEDETTLTFKSDETGKITIKGLPGPSGFDELVYDADADVVYSPLGILNEVSEVDQDSPKLAIGRWKGFQWQLKRGENVLDHIRVRVGIGRLRDEPKGILFYDVAITRHGQAAEKFSRVLLWRAQT